jgi:hypothetical protein
MFRKKETEFRAVNQIRPEDYKELASFTGICNILDKRLPKPLEEAHIYRKFYYDGNRDNSEIGIYGGVTFVEDSYQKPYNKHIFWEKNSRDILNSSMMYLESELPRDFSFRLRPSYPPDASLMTATRHPMIQVFWLNIQKTSSVNMGIPVKDRTSMDIFKDGQIYGNVETLGGLTFDIGTEYGLMKEPDSPVDELAKHFEEDITVAGKVLEAVLNSMKRYQPKLKKIDGSLVLYTDFQKGILGRQEADKLFNETKDMIDELDK